MNEFELTTLVMIGTDGIESCNSNYHAFKTTTTASKSEETTKTGQ
jgi:hypothetical protein